MNNYRDIIKAMNSQEGYSAHLFEKGFGLKNLINLIIQYIVEVTFQIN